MFNFYAQLEMFPVIQKQTFTSPLIAISAHTAHVFSLRTWRRTRDSCK